MIEMISRPRASGKTRDLKLYFHENYDKYEYIVIVAHHAKQTDVFYRYVRPYDRKDKVRLCSRGLPRKSKVLVLIDEPFIMDIDRQNNIVTGLKMCDLDYDIYGIGTEPTREGFGKYIK